MNAGTTDERVTAAGLDPTRWRFGSRLHQSGVNFFICLRCNPPCAKSEDSIPDHERWHEQFDRYRETQRKARQAGSGRTRPAAARESLDGREDDVADAVRRVRTLRESIPRGRLADLLGVTPGGLWRIETKASVKPDELNPLREALDRVEATR